MEIQKGVGNPFLLQGFREYLLYYKEAHTLSSLDCLQGRATYQ